MSHLNDLLLHVDGVCDSGSVRPGLRVLPGLAATSQGQYLLLIKILKSFKNKFGTLGS